MKRSRVFGLTTAMLLAAALMGGCPSPSAPVEFIAGSTGDRTAIGATASVEVLSPASDLAITGGTPIEVNWRITARTRIAVLNVIVDEDQTPDNGNETFAAVNVSIRESGTLLDTTNLAAGDYFIGVTMLEVGDIVAFDYSPGRITLNQRPNLFFTSPRGHFVFDRTENVNPRFDVAWQVNDPDSIVSVRVFLDPDDTPDGDEILLRESNAQVADNFTFNLPTANFAAGVYRILALVSDGVDEFAFYAPGSIRLRSRLAGAIDLRGLELPTAPVVGAVFEGFNFRDNAGSNVGTLRDIDGDGFADFLIVSQFAKPDFELNTQRTGVGEAYLIYGRSTRFRGRVNLNSTGTLFRGDVFTGPPEVPDPIRPSRGISDFTILDDWDNDGVREIAFGLPFTDSLSVAIDVVNEGGSVNAELDQGGYFRTGGVVVCSSSVLRPDLGFPGRNVIDLGQIGTLKHAGTTCTDCRNVDELCPCREGFYGPKAPTSPSGCGATYFHLHMPPAPDATPNPGSVRLGCRFSTLDFSDQCGETISQFEFNSIAISVPNRDPATNTQSTSLVGAGVVSVYFVNPPFFPWTGTNAPPPGNGWPGLPAGPATVIPHGGPYHYILDDQQLVLDVNGGFFAASPGYQLDPDDGPPCNSVFSPDICVRQRTTRIYGGFEGARLGNVDAIDDFNADGLRDLVIGSPLSNEGAGATFLVFGRTRDLIMGGELSIEELGLPANASEPSRRRLFDGIRVVGSSGDRLGTAQASAGDFNGDGIPDVLIGSPLINNRRGGAAIFFGGREVINLTENEIPFNELPTRNLGLIFVGEADGDLAGARVAGIGDLDGDGLDDILIAAPNRSVRMDLDQDGTIDIDRTNCGVVYLVYGSPNLRGTISLSAIGTEALPGAMFIGAGSAHFLGAGLGEQGDRSFGIGTAGDVDGDGRGELLLSSVSASPRGGRVAAGEVYLIYGTGD